MHQRSAVTSDGKPTQQQDLTAHLVASLRYHNQVLSSRRVQDRARIYELEQANARMRREIEVTSPIPRSGNMSVRAKFTVQEVTHHQWGGKTIVLRPQYDTTIPEDQRFAQATPSGELRMQVDNPRAVEELAIGKAFYLDFTPVEG